MQRTNVPHNLETLPTARRLVPVLAPEWAGFPATLTSFVGREQEVAQVSALLQDPQQRLVSLLGPGGVGKTRLAVAVAENVEGMIPDGAAFVPLAPLSHPEEVPGAMATTLGVISHPERTTTQSIIMALQERRFLLVLDNLEHLLAQGIASFVLELLEQCPRLYVLVTSREPLRVNSEQRFLTPPLRTPPAGQNPQALATLPAVRLFVARATGVRQDFALAPDDVAVVVEICRRLDELPLAIELAAAWMRVLTPAALLARLTERLPLLAGGNTDQPARFQTMRAAIRWSYDLLTPEEALALRRLSVFRGGFTVEAASHVILSAEESAGDRDLATLKLIAKLCDKSLLAPADAIGPVQRFTMLETIREFAYGQLALLDDLAGANTAHAEYFRDWLERIEPDFLGPREEHLIELIGAEIGNLNLALYWGTTYNAELAQRMGAALWAYWGLQNPREGLRWLTDALGASSSTPASVRTRALRTAGAIALLIEHNEEAIAFTTEALDVALQSGSRWLEGEARWILAVGVMFGGRIDDAERHLTRAIDLLQPARTPTEMTIAAYARSALGVVAFLKGNRAWGIELYEQAVSDLRTSGGVGIPMIVFTDFAGWLIVLERLTQARQLLHEALLLARRAPTSWLIGGILICLSLADAMEGHAASAAYKLGAVEGIRISRGVTIPVQFQQRVELSTSLASAALEPFAFAEAFEHGKANAAEVVDQLLSDSAGPGFEVAQQQAARRIGLTRRECDVLPYLVAGLSDREIAAKLFISHRTASAHVGRILQRLEATTRGEAAVRAVRLRLV